MKVKSLLTIALAAVAINAAAQDNTPITDAEENIIVKVNNYNVHSYLRPGDNTVEIFIKNPNYRLQCIDFKLNLGDVEGVKFVAANKKGKKFLLNADDFECFEDWTAEGYFQDAEGNTQQTATEGAGILGVTYATAESILGGYGLFEKNEDYVKYATAVINVDAEKFEDKQTIQLKVSNVDFASPDASGRSIYPVGMSPDDNFGWDAPIEANLIDLIIATEAINNINTEAGVASVKYYNLAGAESNTAFEGVNLMVTKYTDGTTKTVKVVK